MITRLARRKTYENAWMTVYEDDVRFANGSQGIYGVVEKPDFSVVVPQHEDGRLQMVELYRYAVSERFWEFPQGAWEGGSDVDPEALAAREMEEETGYRAAKLTRLGTFQEAYGFAKQGCHAFLATGLTEGTLNRDAGEAGMETAAFTRAEIADMIRAGRVVDTVTLAALALLDLGT